MAIAIDLGEVLATQALHHWLRAEDYILSNLVNAILLARGCALLTPILNLFLWLHYQPLSPL